MIAFRPEPLAEPDSDVDLMLRAQDDDRDAFDTLVARYRERTLRLIVSMSVEPHLAEDLAQDLFVRVYQARKNYLPTAKFSTWIGAITRNLVLNAHRDRRRMRTQSSLEMIGETWSRSGSLPQRIVSRETDPVQSAVVQERRQALGRALSRLNERERAAVARFHFGGKSYQAIARETGTTPKAVKSLLARARAKLRESMARSPVAAELAGESGGEVLG